MATKPTREEAEKLVGKRTPLPTQKGAGALNDLSRDKKLPPKQDRIGNMSDPIGLKKSLRGREEAAGLKCGGKVPKKGKK